MIVHLYFTEQSGRTPFNDVSSQRTGLPTREAKTAKN